MIDCKNPSTEPVIRKANLKNTFYLLSVRVHEYTLEQGLPNPLRLSVHIFPSARTAHKGVTAVITVQVNPLGLFLLRPRKLDRQWYFRVFERQNETIRFHH